MPLTKKFLAGLVFVLILPSIAFGQNFLEKKVQTFVAEIYGHYAQENFTKVYNAMHPAVRAVLEKDDYLDFQKHHFNRLRLKISEIQVGDIKANPPLNQSLRELLAEEKNYALYGASLSYRAHFTSGVRLNQKVTKTVFVVVSDPNTKDEALYLLWDPNSLEEEVS